jgi:hypothetical protein
MSTTALPIKERESINLLRHGTRPWNITARNIVQTAEADLARRRANLKIIALRKALREDGCRQANKITSPPLGYAFLEIHVKAADSALGVVDNAIAGIADGQQARHRDTLLLYESVDKLREAASLLLAVAS